MLARQGGSRIKSGMTEKTNMRDFSPDHRWLSINTGTVRKSRGVDLPLPDIIEACVRRGIRAISPWRDQVAAAGLPAISKLVKTHGLELSGYCRGGMFPAADAAGLKAALEDNRRAVDEARELNAQCLVLVVGGLPGGLAGKPEHKDIARSRSQVTDGIAATLEYARSVNMPLAIEPLHPMYAADRACINTLEQALDVCDALDPGKSGALGVAVDAYHVWWDPKLQAQIERAGKARLFAFHVCDWLLPTTDLLNDRGMMGDGVIDLPQMRGWVEGNGFAGYSEVEIFSINNWWQRDHGEVLDTCIARHRSVV
jgi:sugar phosphate isomerase/epimerase